MRSSRWAFSTGAALYRIFIAPIEHSHPRPPQIMRLTRAPAPKLHPTSRHQKRSYVSIPPANKFEKRLPRNEEIRDRMIHIVIEDGTLSPPQYTTSVLSSIDPTTDILVMVAPVPEPGSSDALEWPVCKIVDKKAYYDMLRGKAKKKDNPSNTVKTIELNWAIDPHDLAHRLEKMQGFLAKGFKVEVVMAAKRKGKKATDHEVANVLALVKRAVVEVEGAREWKSMDMKTSGVATIYAEGKKATTQCLPGDASIM